MGLPKKISPDRIRNALVEIKYTSELPPEVLVGYIFNALDHTYLYTSRPMQSSGIEFTQFQFNSGNIFYTDRIRLELKPNTLIFNCNNKYYGWDSYLADIENTMTQISSINQIEVFTKIGMRYISEYPNMDIKEITKYSFAFGIEAVQSRTYTFKTEFDWGDYKTILNLHNKTPRLKANLDNSEAEISLISIIDIDVIAEHLQLKNINELIKKIDDIHTKEKEVFFNIITDEFLNTLDPIY